MKKILFVLIAAFCLCTFISPSITKAQQKYALLISAGQTTADDAFINSEYWYDLFFLYRTLIDLGFTHDHIFVLYGNGTDFASAHPFYNTAAVYPATPNITDFSVSATNVSNIFSWLSTGDVAHGIPQIQSNDYLFYWWMGHGSGCACTDYEALVATTGEHVTDNQFKTYFDSLPLCTIKNQFVMTCRSGGLIDDLEGLHSMIHTAAECCVNAQSDMYDVPHAEFSYHVACALRQQTPAGVAVASDANSNGVIDISEVNTYAHTNTVLSTSQIGDYRSISPLIVPVNATPVSAVVNTGIYCRDFETDNGTEPSIPPYTVWYHGPDLWNRLALDGGTANEDAEFGQTNYVYARIHNIGCSTLDNVSVNFSWCVQSAWANMASWNTITTLTVNGLLSNESRVVNTPWNTVPAPGMYCLHTVLNVAGDMANASGVSYEDNNKEQVNITVVDNVWGWTTVFPFVIENGLDKETAVDIKIEKLNRLASSSKIKIEIPSELKINKVEGAKVQTLQSTTVLTLNSKSKEAKINQVVLKPNEKKMALMVITSPSTTSKRELASVRLTENIQNKEMGGIIFNVRGADQKVVINKLNKKINTLLTMLNKKFKVSDAAKIPTAKTVDVNSFPSLMKRINDFEKSTLPEMSKLLTPNDLEIFKSALAQTAKGLQSNNFSLVKEAQDRLIFSTIPLFLKEAKIAGF